MVFEVSRYSTGRWSNPRMRKRDICPLPSFSCLCVTSETASRIFAARRGARQVRRALVTVYMPGDVHYTDERHATTDCLGLQMGDLLTGDRFPVLARAGHSAEAGYAPRSRDTSRHSPLTASRAYSWNKRAKMRYCSSDTPGGVW